MILENNGARIVDERGDHIDLTGEIAVTVYQNEVTGKFTVHLGPEQPIGPFVTDSWTRRDFRKLERLLLKRAKILMKLQDVQRKIIIADLEAHNGIRDLLDGV